MPSNHPNIQVDLTPECHQNLRSLAKRYRSVRSDVQVVTRELESGNFVGDQVRGVGKRYVVFKVRIRNSDNQQGKSGGYRLIYQVESPTTILLLTLYSKSDREDISANEIREILAEFYESD